MPSFMHELWMIGLLVLDERGDVTIYVDSLAVKGLFHCQLHINYPYMTV